MRRTPVLLCAAGLVVLVTALILPRALRPGSALELDRDAYAHLEMAFADLISGATDAPPRDFVVEAITRPFQGVLIDEPEGACRGGGTYLLSNMPAALPLLVSAPHRGSDLLTGPLVLRLFLEGDAAAAAWNSVGRRSKCGAGSSDLARLELHPFTAFSSAFARSFPRGRIVQVHGFSQERRTTAEGRAASIIVSSATRRVSAAVHAVAECLEARFPQDTIAVFPHEVSELGAQRNAQGQRLRALEFNGFVHLELSLDLRQRLMNEPELRSRFGACLGAEL